MEDSNISRELQPEGLLEAATWLIDLLCNTCHHGCADGISIETSMANGHTPPSWTAAMALAGAYPFSM
eukprot:scaffold48719_cov76-Attheya_sp.AAC.2